MRTLSATRNRRRSRGCARSSRKARIVTGFGQQRASLQGHPVRLASRGYFSPRSRRADRRDGGARRGAGGTQSRAGTAREARGADVNATSPNGMTALRTASEYGRAEIVRLLLSKGANPNAVTKQPAGNNTLWLSTALLRAIPNVEIVTLLLENGADPNLTDKSSNDTPLTLACGRSAEIVKLLLDHHADPNLRGPRGTIPVRAAIAHGDDTAVLALLNAHADPNSLAFSEDANHNQAEPHITPAIESVVSRRRQRSSSSSIMERTRRSALPMGRRRSSWRFKRATRNRSPCYFRRTLIPMMPPTTPACRHFSPPWKCGTRRW